MKPILHIHPDDNVAVALQDLQAGMTLDVDGDAIMIREAIPQKHKLALKAFAEGQKIILYGVTVGVVTKPIAEGEWINTTNVRHAAEAYGWRNTVPVWEAPDVSEFRNRSFMGFRRSDGQVGTANYWLFIPTVFCENRNLDVIREALHEELGYALTDKYKRYTRGLVENLRSGIALDEWEWKEPLDIKEKPTERVFPHVDGIKFLNHQGGCGGTRQDSEVLGRLLAAYADHPNVGGVTILSLGCQHLQMQQLVEEIHRRNPSFDKPLLLFEQQQSSSEEDLIRNAIRETLKGLAKINTYRREPCGLEHLTMGVKCGGSDGFSGISANPAVGYAADLLVALGGKVLLAEFPELCGAEQWLIDRCVSEDVALKFIRLMESYDAWAHQSGSGFFMNPSPGNIRDGLITDAMKSCGAAKKGGSSPVVDVLDYTEPALKPGLSLVCTPGNDVEATTGKAASGANLILFTTGLGTPTGNPICPTIKISTNTALAKRMPDIIDIDTGPVVTGEKSLEQMGKEILEYCIRVAGGEVEPKAVTLQQDDFIPWKRGVSL